MRKKLIFWRGNYEIGNAAKFWHDGKNRKTDSDSVTQNYIEIAGFISVRKKSYLLMACRNMLRTNDQKKKQASWVFLELIQLNWQNLYITYFEDWKSEIEVGLWQFIHQVSQNYKLISQKKQKRLLSFSFF